MNIQHVHGSEFLLSKIKKEKKIKHYALGMNALNFVSNCVFFFFSYSKCVKKLSPRFYADFF